jgi:ubiquinone/menaquinone biosynthesis C-methylase UbiE
MTEPSGNAAQAERWNGEGGQLWIAHRERHVAEHQRLIPHLFGAAAIAPGDHVLDVGCGCGETTIAAARAASGPISQGTTGGQRTPGPGAPDPGGSALGLDLSGPMLGVARRLAADAGVASARFEQGDAQVHPLPRDAYDVVISKFGVMFFADPAAAFANIAAGAREGGRLAFLCWQDDQHNEVFSIPLAAFLSCDALACTPLPAPYRDGLFENPRRVSELLSGAGWEDVRIEALNEPAWMGSDVADVMSYVRDTRVVRGLAAELGDDALIERVLASLAEQYAARQRPDGVWVRAGAWLVTARRGAGGPGR